MDLIDTDQIDERLRAAYTEEMPDASAVQAAVRRRIAAERVRRYTILAAAAAILLAVAGYASFPYTRGASVFADLATDHRREVIERQPRHWRTEAAEIRTLFARYGVTEEMAGAIAPASFHLEHAKTCGMAGQPVLHLVYSDGSRQVSVYLRKSNGPHIRSGSATIDSEQVAAFTRDGFDAAIVTVGNSAECRAWARRAALIL